MAKPCTDDELIKLAHEHFGQFVDLTALTSMIADARTEEAHQEDAVLDAEEIG